MSTSRTYRATYGTQPCQFILAAGATTGAVLLDRDPGYGSMIYTRIHVTQVELGEEIPPMTAEAKAELVRGELTWRVKV